MHLGEEMRYQLVACLLLTLVSTRFAMAESPFDEEPSGTIEGFYQVPTAVPVPVQQETASVPADAQKLITAFDKEAAEIRKKAQQEVIEKQKKLIEKLQKMQDDYSKPGTLDAAVAVRDRIRQLKSSLSLVGIEPKPDPGSLSAWRGQVGRVMHFRVTGRPGYIWGTAVYTDDSALATAAVHAGVLRNGETGVVKVTIMAGQGSYAGSQNNGISSYDFPGFPGSYQVSAP